MKEEERSKGKFKRDDKEGKGKNDEDEKQYKSLNQTMKYWPLQILKLTQNLEKNWLGFWGYGEGHPF